MDTMYRRRAAGRGSRMAGRKRTGGLPARERRRLLQLGASIVLFLLVYFGRGVLPGQVAVWQVILNTDADFQGAAAAFGQILSDEGDVLKALDVFLSGEDSGGVDEQDEPQDSTVEVPLPKLTAYSDRAYAPGIGTRPLPEQTAVFVEQEPKIEEEEPVVTAVAQVYDEQGEPLPERISLQYYVLGLEETAVPVMGTVTSGFGYRDHPVSGEYSFHTAIDIGVDTGTDVLAFGEGTVRYIGENDVFGLYLKIDHDNGVSTFYAHCDELLVGKGDEVTCGQVIAKSGETGNATGPHLHFSIEKDGIRLDPAYYLDLE